MNDSKFEKALALKLFLLGLGIVSLVCCGSSNNLSEAPFSGVPGKPGQKPVTPPATEGTGADFIKSIFISDSSKALVMVENNQTWVHLTQPQWRAQSID